MLKECVRSVSHMMPVRTWKVEHLWLVDEDYDGCSKTMNRLARMAKGKWIVPLADDDLVLPCFLRDHAGVSEDADIVYAPPYVTGPEAGGEEQFHASPPNIPATAMIRKSLWDELGGYREDFAQTEDMVFFNAAMERGARFARVDRQSWQYRFHGGNKSRGHVPGA